MLVTLIPHVLTRPSTRPLSLIPLPVPSSISSAARILFFNKTFSHLFFIPSPPLPSLSISTLYLISSIKLFFSPHPFCFSIPLSPYSPNLPSPEGIDCGCDVVMSQYAPLSVHMTVSSAFDKSAPRGQFVFTSIQFIFSRAHELSVTSLY